MPVKLGILKGFVGGTDSYELYVEACKDLEVDYELVDIIGANWMDNVRRSQCDGFLVRPSPRYDVWKRMFDERLYFVERKLNKFIYPTYDELFMYENKRIMAYWLTLHAIPSPKTWVLYDREEALRFLERTEYPIVFKTHIGATATGVEIMRTRREARRLIDRVFTIGYGRKMCISLKGLLKNKIAVPGLNPAYYLEREYKTALIQEYVPNVREWRVTCIGGSYFGYEKLKRGDFHSGGKLFGWGDPPRALLDFARHVCEISGFTSMALDVFVTERDEYLVNEMQCLFGQTNPSQMYIEGKPGCYRYNSECDTWKFEEGYFNQNGSCNLRVRHCVELIQQRVRGGLVSSAVLK
jgi:glutathione synthase/RimK-type ligase-like ATP-grasp enzyme